MRLAPAGARLVQTWFAGEPVSSQCEHRRLAHRLVAGGYAHYSMAGQLAVAEQSDTLADVTVVIPVKDDLDGLRDTLARLTGDESGRAAQQLKRIIVVDNASRKPVNTADLKLQPRAEPVVEVIRSRTASGPGAARNQGMSEVATPLVAFVDAGVEADSDQLRPLAKLIRQTCTVAAAPRVTSTLHSGQIAAYELSSSPLDMGPRPSVVGPGCPVSYVPSACLVADTQAVAAVGGFDPSLRYGEDVDLIRRLGANGLVLYHPDAMVGHPPRGTVSSFVKQRFNYGTSAGPLAARHGQALAPVGLSQWFVAVAAASTLVRRPWRMFLFAGAFAGRVTWLRDRIEMLDEPVAEATLLATREVSGHLDGLLAACRRPWSPLIALVGLLRPGPVRHMAVSALLLAWSRRLAAERTTSPMGGVLTVCDDVAYSAGVVVGAARCGELSPLLPAIRPGTDRAAGRC